MNIPDKAVEAAVNARGRRNNPKWDNEIFGYEQFSEDQRAFLCDEARAILEAAAPYIAAQALRERANTIKLTAPDDGLVHVDDVVEDTRDMADFLDPTDGSGEV